jgi:alcohol oxidase
LSAVTYLYFLSYETGGAAGSVIAGRLAKADPSLQIVIVESGLTNDSPNITTPGYAFDNLGQPDSPYFDLYVSNPSEYVNGREVVVQTGRILGGGSSVNLMMYSRPAASDIDDWDTEGWSFNDLEPLYKKV